MDLLFESRRGRSSTKSVTETKKRGRIKVHGRSIDGLCLCSESQTMQVSSWCHSPNVSHQARLKVKAGGKEGDPEFGSNLGTRFVAELEIAGTSSCLRPFAAIVLQVFVRLCNL
jgi:hypothetical protein